MTGTSAIFLEDMERITSEPLPWDSLKDASVLITGATGLIGMTTIKALLHADTVHGLHMQIFAIVRDPAKAGRIFSESISDPRLQFLKGTMEELPPLPQKIDYWIHGACPTASAL